MTPWEILGLPPDADERSIRKRYAERLRLTRPDEDPQGFQRLREAYEALRDRAAEPTPILRRPSDPEPSPRIVVDDRPAPITVIVPPRIDTPPIVEPEAATPAKFERPEGSPEPPEDAAPDTPRVDAPVERPPSADELLAEADAVIAGSARPAEDLKRWWQNHPRLGSIDSRDSAEIGLLRLLATRGDLSPRTVGRLVDLFDWRTPKTVKWLAAAHPGVKAWIQSLWPRLVRQDFDDFLEHGPFRSREAGPIARERRDLDDLRRPPEPLWRLLLRCTFDGDLAKRRALAIGHVTQVLGPNTVAANLDPRQMARAFALADPARGSPLRLAVAGLRVVAAFLSAVAIWVLFSGIHYAETRQDSGVDLGVLALAFVAIPILLLLIAALQWLVAHWRMREDRWREGVRAVVLTHRRMFTALAVAAAVATLVHDALPGRSPVTVWVLAPVVLYRFGWRTMFSLLLVMHSALTVSARWVDTPLDRLARVALGLAAFASLYGACVELAGPDDRVKVNLSGDPTFMHYRSACLMWSIILAALTTLVSGLLVR